MEQRRSAVSAETTRGAVVKALLAAKAEGTIDGIYGRLGDLGAISGKYDIAVSTACGALDYIVVATTSAAQRCVDLLRRHNLGVATFLILEKQQHLASKCALPSHKPRHTNSPPHPGFLCLCSNPLFGVSLLFRILVVRLQFRRGCRPPPKGQEARCDY